MPSTPDTTPDLALQVDDPAGPWDRGLDPLTEGFKTRVVFLVDGSGANDKLVAIWRDGANMRLRDVTNPGSGGVGFTLTQLLAGAGGGDNADSLFNDLNESYDLLYTETLGIISGVLAHAPGAPATKIREIDQITNDANGQLSGMRIRQFAGDGTTVLETLTYSPSGWVKT